MSELTPEEKDFEYTLGNIILSNHISTDKRVKMIREVMEIHGYSQLAKSQVCPDEVQWCPYIDTEKCPLSTCQGKAELVD